MRDYMTKSISRRVVVHFPGFEKMNAQAHYSRFKRSVHSSTKVWNYSAEISPLADDAARPQFTVSSAVAGQETFTSIYLCDHNALVEKFSDKPVLRRILSGFCSAVLVVLYGGAAGYFRHAWRFGVFFLFPYLLMSFGLSASLLFASSPFWLDLPPLHYAWSVPLAWIFFRWGFVPFSERYFTLHLFADWQLAVSAARMNDPDLSRWLEECSRCLADALAEPADEYVISSHSMGSTLSVHALGMVLENDPMVLAGKKVVFLTLGGAILQSALLRPAETLRARVGIIARAREVSFVEVHCLTDIIHFYRCRVVALCGHPHVVQARRIYIRVKALLEPERYRRIKRDFLRVHRQYVLHADRRGSFDFSLSVIGPFPAHSTDDFATRDWQGL
jgi:hypothetical protein